MEAERQTTLALSRKPGEKIHIGDDIVLEVKTCRAGRTTIAVMAPLRVRILRGELYELTKPEPAA
jgi:carbon storage regulator CsrA